MIVPSRWSYGKQSLLSEEVERSFICRDSATQIHWGAHKLVNADRDKSYSSSLCSKCASWKRSFITYEIIASNESTVRCFIGIFDSLHRMAYNKCLTVLA